MPTTATILSDEPQRGGRRRVLVEFDNGTGTTWRKDRLIPAGADAQALADAAITREDGIQRQRERNEWAELFLAGVDLDILPAPQFNTLIQVRRVALRRLLNLMRSAVPDEGKAMIAINVLPYLSKYTNAQIAGVIDGPRWTAARVGQVRSKLQAIADALNDLDHGEPEI